MMQTITLEQNPKPYSHHLFFRGDTIIFSLRSNYVIEGTTAYLRCNIGYATIRRQEIIRKVETQYPISSQDWHDLPMEEVEPGFFKIRLALNEVGHFEGKCFLVLKDQKDPLWPEGANVHINVEPATYCCANSVYCAFVRQFGPNKNEAITKPLRTREFVLQELDDENYTVIPPSGTFRSLIKELDFIIYSLNCRIIHLLPINPTPTTYARMGRFGSPYAALDFTAVDPALAEFDRKATPLDQFLELVDAVHLRNAKVFLDIAINHTGWAAKIHETNPEWLVRDEDNSIHSPGAWGVVWGDLTELNHKRLDLWQYMANVFMTWCSRGVDGFRCDAGYMIPFEAWQYIIAHVRKAYPDTVFLLEGLGGDPQVTLNLLNQANMNWAYSELFQNYSKIAIEGYVNYSNKVSNEDGILIHYAETHDNTRLASVSHKWAQMRTALSAMTSHNGSFGFANGVEWFASERIDVHQSSALHWGNPHNQVDFIAQLNKILAIHPAFHPGATLRFIEGQTDNAVLFLRTDKALQYPLLVCINLNHTGRTAITWQCSNTPFKINDIFIDLISGRTIEPGKTIQNGKTLILDAGEVLCLSLVPLLTFGELSSVPQRIRQQELRALILDLLTDEDPDNSIPLNFDIDEHVQQLYQDPLKYLYQLNNKSQTSSIVQWTWPTDLYRQTMLPPKHILFVSAKTQFRAALIHPNGSILRFWDAIQDASGNFVVIFTPLPTPEKHLSLTLRIFTTENNRSTRKDAQILLLSPFVQTAKTEYQFQDLFHQKHTILLTNQKGAMCRTCVEWGVLRSRYDALLAANLSPKFPEDRHIMLRRIRLQINHHDRIEEMRLELTRRFILNANNEPVWDFTVPIGKGESIDLQIRLFMPKGENAVNLNIRRLAKNDHSTDLITFKLLASPDIEDRNFHNDTKAISGLENYWPKVITPQKKGFVFAPAKDRILHVSSNVGQFISQPYWTYNVFQEKEATRGLEAYNDLYCPGRFEIPIDINEEIQISAYIARSDVEKPLIHELCPLEESLWTTPADNQIESILHRAMQHFIVDRDQWKTVIAGYPWFLDWGRDTLICTRGLLAGGFYHEVHDIILQFSKFAEKGTIPNIIHGSNVSNRDTSDAPLWLFVAVSDYIKITHDHKILQETPQPQKTLLQLLIELADSYQSGTSNKIKVHAESNLVYSPAHFTWMDTNYPAGTPRQGYPIEIQALWFAAQNSLYQFTHDEKWSNGAKKTQHAVLQKFILKSGYLADCLLIDSADLPIENAIPADHLRPNQLFAITLGLIDDPEIGKKILENCAQLLIPGAIRSLADIDMEIPLNIIFNGNSLRNPHHPYCGRYEGNEDFSRKPAYHNGTAWGWPFPSYAEALVLVYGKTAIPTATALLSSIQLSLEQGSIGQLSEIADGNYPHQERGCDAQAWSVTEAYRVWTWLKQE